jgi:tetratricopeptide (TPR) repeat protein
MRRPVEARALIEQARKADPGLAATYDTEGMLFDADNKDDRADNARAAYAKAAELGSTNYYTHYRLASLTWQPNSDAEALTAIKKSLDRSIALNDRFAGAYSLLGEVQARLHQTDEALAAARRAVVLEGGSVFSRLSLARVLWNLSRTEEAETAARNALTLARTDGDRRAAQELLDFIVKNRKT